MVETGEHGAALEGDFCSRAASLACFLLFQATAHSRQLVQETPWNPAESMRGVDPPEVGEVL